MTGYTKLFGGELITSSIWQEPNDCKVLWITILACKEADDICRATIPFLAKTASLSLEDCQKYLKQFQEPDPYSRSSDHEGRRIKKVPEGFFVLNGSKYREKLSETARKEYNRKRMAAWRQKQKDKEKVRSTTGDSLVTVCAHSTESEYRVQNKESTLFELDCVDSAKKILSFLNKRTGKNFRINNRSHLKIISSRLKEEGINESSIIKMIEFKCGEWMGTDFEKYLRPLTLFNSRKFHEYYDAANEVKPTEEENKDW